MIARVLDAGLPCAWVLADALYGSDSKLRRMLEERGQAYVLAVRSNHTLRFLEDWAIVQTDPATPGKRRLAEALYEDPWQSLTAGEGAKGPRLYEWARVPLTQDKQADFERWLLVRRSRRDPEALAYFFTHAPKGTTLAELAAAAGLRWTIEECFLRAKDDLGLDHCEARSWHGWHRHISLVMAAAALLAKLSADQRRSAYSKGDKRSPKATSGGLTLALAKLLTTPEIRTLIAKLLLSPINHPAFVWAGSRWRRNHQRAAAISHRKKTP